MERPAWAPQGIDLSVPSVSRIYDYYLGGSHNFEVDREAARQAMEIFPGLPKIMQANRAFMRRAVRYAVDQGITQFLDIGSGIPTFGNVHEVAQAASPGARVLYVDSDPVAVAHSRAVLDGNPTARIAAADLRTPKNILTSPEATELLDFDRPVALLLVAVLHFLADEDDPAAAVAELRDALAPGSLLVLTHASTEGGPISPEQGGGVQGVYRKASSPLIMRTRSEVAAFFEGFELIEPGLVSMPDWHPDTPAGHEEDPAAFVGFAGVGLKA
ncbi:MULTISPECIES: SAM-dependent methyltransferase [unclassified Streptomyces]|uniref:SAM-dependent methyltransferase n=1 Tax=unclassified Streptomyces TaxID=2593676 RepID=UPI0020333C76|nr:MULTISPECIES: SAM-dependent methyltransferase [unclassified Streptomyces]MCM2418209.1 SAM-dependent methyltransferase [Streptomyces sp. RKAG293]MCM2429623.1 SAM-dependent methyltransferase [Streptomyces sp. RKAG337]